MNGRDSRNFIAAAGLIADRWPHGLTEKMGSLEPGTREWDFMIAAMVFDVQRKLKLLFLASRDVIEEQIEEGTLSDDTRAIAARVRDHYGDMPGPEDGWERTARYFEDIARKLQREIHEDYESLLERAAGPEKGDAS